VLSQYELKNILSSRASELDYTYERFSNGDSEYLVYPTMAQGRHTINQLEGPAMRYRFTGEGEGK
jgi:hypothetical protein